MSDRRPPDLEGRGHLRRLRIDARRDQVSDEALAGPWRAWKAIVPPAVLAEWPSSLPRWFIHAPGAHPLWDWHTVSGCHLRDVPGMPPAKLHRPDASHELNIFALDPKWSVDVDPSAVVSRHFLTPPNMVHQVVGIDDEQAEELLYLFVRAIVNGIANPDDDFRSVNANMLDATAAHLREGKHLPS